MKEDPLFRLHMTLSILCAQGVITAEEHDAFEELLEKVEIRMDGEEQR